MLIGKSFRLINGNEIKDNDQYRLTDVVALTNLTVSLTELKKRQSTNGHAHEGKDEVYIFTNGQGTIQVNDALIPVQAGDVVVIPQGSFHKVCSSSNQELEFLSIFESYKRQS